MAGTQEIFLLGKAMIIIGLKNVVKYKVNPFVRERERELDKLVVPSPKQLNKHFKKNEPC